MEEIDRELNEHHTKHRKYKPKVMMKVKRKVQRKRKDSFIDSEGVHHDHVSEHESEEEVEIDQYGHVIERNEDGTIKDGVRMDDHIREDDPDEVKMKKIMNKIVNDPENPDNPFNTGKKLTKEDLKRIAEENNI